MGKVASDYTKKRLKGKYVDLEFEGRQRGNYGRLLAYITVDNVLFNLELVAYGFSPYYTKYGLGQRYDKQFREAENHARMNELGIWSDPKLSEKYSNLESEWDQPTSQIQPTNAREQTEYHGNIKSKKFHKPECRYYDCKNCVSIFYSREEAIQVGYIPCKVCRP